MLSLGLALTAVAAAAAASSDDTRMEVEVGADGSHADAGAVPPPHDGGRNAAWLHAYDPVAAAAAVVTHGAARFTVLTSGVVRAEWSPHSPQRFHDAATFAIVHRRLAPPPFSSAVDGALLTLETADVRLEYRADVDARGGFTAGNLRVEVRSLGTVWQPGAAASGSLHGTIRTLDRYNRAHDIGCRQPAYMNDTHCEEGVVSRDGWAIIDDSLGARWDDVAGEWPWTTGPAERPPLPAADTCTAQGWDRWECLWGNTPDEAACAARGCCYDAAAADTARGQPTAMHFVAWCWWPRPAPGSASYTDLYIFGHGHDYTRALRDYVALAGHVPQMPRWMLGPMYSRWFAYVDFEFRTAIPGVFARNGIPLDTMIVDMDWHDSFPRGVPQVPPGVPVEPWTGWTLNRDVLPEPAALMAALRARGVRVIFNLHPHFGVQFYDAVYNAFALALGRTGEAAIGLPLLGDYTNKSYTEPFLDLVIRQLDDAGVSAMWIDWQAGEWTPVLGMSPTAWLSYVHSSNPFRYGNITSYAHRSSSASSTIFHASDRPVVLNRWGGLGSHRYPVGFSGDADTTWEILRWQAYMTPTAANVAWSWSHDIGGFAGQPSEELLIRWVQFGTFSPILRPHTAGRGGSHRDIWRFPFGTFEIARDYYRLRARLMPYIARSGREAYETGLILTRPLYYSWPEAEGAYSEQAQHQYMFGSDILVAPITTQADSDVRAVGLAAQPLWLPPGEWLEWFSWDLLSGGDGGAHVTRRYEHAEMPLFCRPGAILPLRTLPDSSDQLGRASDVPDDLTLWVFPASAAQLAAAAPDDGESQVDAAAGDEHGPPPAGYHESHSTLYDDDGLSTAYVGGEFVRTPVSCVWHVGGSAAEPPAEGAGAGGGDDDGAWDADAIADASELAESDRVLCELGGGGDGTDEEAHDGAGFAGFPAGRRYSWRFVGSAPPARVRVNGHDVPLDAAGAPDAWGDSSRFVPGANAWAYSASTASVWVRVGHPADVATSSRLSVELRFERGQRVLGHPLLTSGTPRMFARAQAAKGQLNRVGFDAHAVDTPSLYRALAVPPRLEAAPAWPLALQLLGTVRDELRAGAAEAQALHDVRGVGTDVTDRVVGLLRDAVRDSDGEAAAA